MSTALASLQRGETGKQISARVGPYRSVEDDSFYESSLHPTIEKELSIRLRLRDRQLLLCLGYAPYRLITHDQLSNAIWGTSMAGYRNKVLSRKIVALRTRRGLIVEGRMSHHSYIFWPEGFRKAPNSVLGDNVVRIGSLLTVRPLRVIPNLLFDIGAGRLWLEDEQNALLTEKPLSRYTTRALRALTTDLNRVWVHEELGLAVWPDCYETARASATDKLADVLRELRKQGIAYQTARRKVQLIVSEGGR